MTIAADAPGWARPPRARQWHYFAGVQSSCERWAARPRMDFAADPPPEHRCGRCQYNAFGRGPSEHRAVAARRAGLPGELAVAATRDFTRGRRNRDIVRVSVALLKALLKLADGQEKRS